MNNTNISCPKCGHTFDVSTSLSKQLKEQYESDYNNKMLSLKQQHEDKARSLTKLKEQIEIKENELNISIEKGVLQKLKSVRSIIEKKLRAEIDTEKSEEIKSYQEQLQLKINEAKELNKLKAEFQKIQREKQELKEHLEAEMQTRLTDELSAAKIKIKRDIENTSSLKIAEKELVINQLKEQLHIAQRQADRIPNQVTGEAQEKVIENYLKTNCPIDEIQEIKKGVKGADCLHVIKNVINQVCGSIYYESKRTKDFQKGWIEKFKKDMRSTKAIFGVIVTEAYPKDMERMGQKDGVWICSFEEFKGLSMVLRESILLMHQITISQENKGGKMEVLYQFLVGTQFRGHIEAIVEGFVQMNQDLAKERRAMEGLWKQREKQIEKVLINTSEMYHSIRGIAGNAVASIKQLELPGDDDKHLKN